LGFLLNVSLMYKINT